MCIRDRAYIKFTEAREMLNNYEQQLADAKQQYEDAKQKAMENSCLLYTSRCV